MGLSWLKQAHVYCLASPPKDDKTSMADQEFVTRVKPRMPGRTRKSKLRAFISREPRPILNEHQSVMMAKTVHQPLKTVSPGLQIGHLLPIFLAKAKTSGLRQPAIFKLQKRLRAREGLARHQAYLPILSESEDAQVRLSWGAGGSQHQFVTGIIVVAQLIALLGAEQLWPQLIF